HGWKPAKAMANYTTCSQPTNFYIACTLNDGGRKCHSFICTFTVSTSITIAVLSPVAVVGNILILAAIWKKTFVRTPFHFLMSGLAFTDLCTGLVAQPFYAANILLYSANPGIVRDKPVLVITLKTIAAGSSTYFAFITLLLITLISIERWLHMTRRSLITSRRGCFTVIILLLIPIPMVVFVV
ncbi:G-protein coupled receptor, partial [Desmophyllum pertusum]